MAKFILTNATYNFSFVDCSVILTLKTETFHPTIPLLSPSSTTAVVLKLFLSFPTLNKGGYSSPLLTLPEGTQVQVWPDVISQSSPHLFSTSLPVITSCPIQIKALHFFFLSCVNCVKIFYCVNRGCINRIDSRVNADSPNIYSSSSSSSSLSLSLLSSASLEEVHPSLVYLQTHSGLPYVTHTHTHTHTHKYRFD